MVHTPITPLHWPSEELPASIAPDKQAEIVELFVADGHDTFHDRPISVEFDRLDDACSARPGRLDLLQERVPVVNRPPGVGALERQRRR
jgi:hypothetical protein